jgi:type IV pilus assembly protein PilC
MALFSYEATTDIGEMRTGEFEALNREAAIEHLRKRGLIPLTLVAREPVRGASLSLRGISRWFDSITPLDRIGIAHNLAAALKAGLSIIESLDILIADATKPQVRSLLLRTRTNLESGRPLSETFRSYGEMFPPFFIGMVRSGEASGHLDLALESLSGYLRKEYRLSKKVRAAFAYPGFLLVAASGVVGLLLFFVVPRLSRLFTTSGVELPLLTRMLLVVSRILTWSPFLDLVGIALLVWGWFWLRHSSFGRSFIFRIGFRLPLVRDLLKNVALVRFSRTLGNLLSGGIPIVEALDLSADAAGNPVYGSAIRHMMSEMRLGFTLSKTMEKHPQLFPRFLLSLTAVGERTGTLETILKTFADFYEERVDEMLKNLTTFLEPILLLIMGLIIGAVALAIVLPIYQLVGTFA